MIELFCTIGFFVLLFWWSAENDKKQNALELEEMEERAKNIKKRKIDEWIKHQEKDWDYKRLRENYKLFDDMGIYYDEYED